MSNPFNRLYFFVTLLNIAEKNLPRVLNSAAYSTQGCRTQHRAYWLVRADNVALYSLRVDLLVICKKFQKVFHEKVFGIDLPRVL